MDDLVQALVQEIALQQPYLSDEVETIYFGAPEEVTEIKTFYEQQYLEINKAITYIRFKIN